MANFQEIRPRLITRYGPRQRKGRRRFKCLNTYAASLESALWGSVFPGYGGPYAPKCYRVDRQDAYTGFSRDWGLVVAHYGTQRIPGTAVQRYTTGYRVEKRRREVVGGNRIIEGLDPDGVHEWRVVQGTNTVVVSTIRVILETAYVDFDMSVITPRLNHVNNKRFLGANARKLLLLGTPETRWWPERDMWYVDYAFAYSGWYETWDETLESQKGILSARPVVVLDADGNVPTTQPKKYQGVWVPKEVKFNTDHTVKTSPAPTGTAAESRRLYPSASFSDLERLLK